MGVSASLRDQSFTSTRLDLKLPDGEIDGQPKWPAGVLETVNAELAQGDPLC